VLCYLLTSATAVLTTGQRPVHVDSGMPLLSSCRDHSGEGEADEKKRE
jgi:hypothetical protein